MEKLSYSEYGKLHGYSKCDNSKLLYKEYCLICTLGLIEYFDKCFRNCDNLNYKLDFARTCGNICYTCNFKSSEIPYHEVNIKEIYNGTNSKWEEFRTNINEATNHIGIVKEGLKHESFIIHTWYNVKEYDKRFINGVKDFKYEILFNKPFYWCIGKSNWFNDNGREINTKIEPICKGRTPGALIDAMRNLEILEQKKKKERF